MRILIGTSALNKHGLTLRQPKDTDVFVDAKESINKGDDYIIMPKHILSMFGGEVASPDEVYTIKCSHLGWDEHKVGRSQFGGSKLWDKHYRDVINLSHKCKLIPDLYIELCNHWRTVLGNKSYLNLDRKSDEFFNDHVNYKYNHDELHELVAAPNRPLYEKILKEDCDVLVSKDKFNLLTRDEQINLFHEEMTVIAIERYIVHGVSPLLAWRSSVKKTVTRLTKNWACDFICANMHEFKSPRYDLNVLEKG